MRFLRLAVVLLCAIAVVAEKDETKGRDKRQHLSFHPRRSGRPPPYAVQMEPIAHYSQRDPLYNPLTADSKSDDQNGYYEETPYNYYPTEPEPIIEIIIKESNESLPTPVPPTPPPNQKPKKEPIQVFYVKYEKKQEYGEDKPRVVYDTPIPALVPVEEHEEIKPDVEEQDGYPAENVHPVTPPPPEPSTTLRALIRPDSELYDSGSSGIRVTFGTDQVPPNLHNKRSDKDAPAELIPSRPTALPPPGSSKRPHGPFAPIQPIPPRVTPAFPQQRIVNSFAQQQLLGPPNGPPQQGLPPNFNLQPQFHQSVPPQVRNQYQPIHLQSQRPQQRPAITIQGLPEVQQRLPFNSFVPPHRLNVNHPQQPGSPPTLSISHQNVQLQNFPQQLPPNQPPTNFNFDPTLQYKQQREQDKQRYIEQQRLSEQRQQEQKRQQEQQQQQQQRLHEQQRQQEQYRLLEQRRKQEQEQKLRLHQQQHQQQQQQQQQQQHHQQQQQHQQQQYQQQFKFGHLQSSQPPQSVPVQQQQKPLGGEILKAIPKLEQHYAIRENPLHPGPFPPNPEFAELAQTSFAAANSQQFTNSLQQHNLAQQQQNLIQQSNLVHQSNLIQQPQSQQSFAPQQTIKYNTILKQHQQQQQQQQQSGQQQSHQPQQQQQQQLQKQPQANYQNQQSFFLQNLGTAHQQRPEGAVPNSSPIWGRPVFQGKNLNSNQKIYATPVTKTEDESKKVSPSTPNSIRYNPTTLRPTTVTVPPTSPPTTPLTTTTLSPKHEAKIKENIANLPDEVPDDIREQLLSSGILGNADIQILDYDKVGGINIGDLPPEALANFYGAGGAAATAASEPVPRIAKRPKAVDELQIAASSASVGKNSLLGDEVRTEEVTLRPGGVEMKVVRFDPNTAQGQTIADRHINENATRLSPVALGEPASGQYNRYLPLKVSGASFPIPTVPELSGKRISSVVVLAPVDYSFQPEASEQQLTRQNRKIASDVQAIRFLAGESLKQLVKKPSAENYKRWLEQERQTEPQRQSVVLLVTTPKDDSEAEKEIFMYDVTSESVSKLAGDLSSAFVDAAESNSDVDPMDEVPTTQ